MIQKIKTIVCGSTFGQYYIEALKKYECFFEVIGLYARGSERSVKLAKRNNIPLFTSIDEIPEDIQLACVVIRSEGVGGEGCDLAIKLMERGIHVIQEQPVYPKKVIECYQVARKNNVIYNIGNHYTQLPAVQCFIKTSKTLSTLNRAKYINLCFCTQVAYPALAILVEALPSFREWKNLSVIKNNGPFDIITGQAGNIPMTIEFNNEINPQIPDDLMHVLHRFSVFFQSGTLTLEDTFGPVAWRPRIYIEKYGYETDKDKKLKEPSLTLIDKYEEKEIEKIFQEEWSMAIGQEIIEIKKQMENKKINSHKAQKDLLVSKLWEELYHIAGYANFINEIDYRYIPSSKIRKIN